jgi:hypothetical protein
MRELAKSRNEKILDALDKVELWARRAVFCLVVLAVLMAVVAPTAVAYAQGGDPPTDEAANNLVGIFTELGKLAIRVIYALIMIVFAVGTVKAGLGAQAAQAFGATGRVSLEMMNLVGGIVVFGIAVMALPLANMIIDSVTGKLLGGGFSVEIHNPFAP